MHLIRPIIYTLLYVIFIEIIGFWVLIAYAFEADLLMEYYLLINSLIMVVALIIFTYYANSRTLKMPQKTTIDWYLFSILFGVSYIFLQTPLNWFYNLFSTQQYDIIYEFNGFETFNINLLATIILIPIAEELFFREFLQKNLQNKTRPIVVIGLITVLFAAIHLPYEYFLFDYHTFSPHRAFIILFGGLALGIVYYKSRSIGPPIVLHMLWNFMVVLA
jgi:membrane protease YdiL (CAAX protease family)